MGDFRPKTMPETSPLPKRPPGYLLNGSPKTARKGSDTVGEIAGLVESSTYVGKSARIVASIRTEKDYFRSLLNHNAKYKRLLPPRCDFANGVPPFLLQLAGTSPAD